MKMRKTKIKFMSLLLAVMMIVGMLPTTALAAGNYPKASNVFVDGGKSFYNNRLYYKKGDQDKNFTGNEGDYIAHYNPATGTLTLNGYSGGSISVGGVGRTDITVVLKGTNIIDGSLTNEVGGDITVTSSDGGTLSISKTTSGSNPAIGIETGLSGSYTTGNVTITGDAKVTIDMTHNGTQGFDKAYGIFAKENITISEKASVGITCATPSNTAIDASNCNGLRAGKDVTINTTGEVKIDVTKAGKNDAYSIGVYPSGNAILTRVGDMAVEWKNHGTNTSFTGGAIYGGGSFDTSTHAVNVDTNNRYASYRYGTPHYTVTVKNGTLTGPGVKYANGSGNFLENDTVNITPDTKTSESGGSIPFKEWTAEGVTLTSTTTADTSFSVPTNNVTVTATHSPFIGAPTFKRGSGESGTIEFQTAVKPNDGTEFFQYVEVGKENDPYGYQSISSQPTTASTASPYEYSVTASTGYTTVIQYLEAGNYRMAVTLNGTRYLSDPFTVDYTAPVTTYTVSFDANGGTGTMADVTGVSGEYTLPANGFTAPAGKQFKAWSVGGSEKAVGDKITVTANTTVTAVWENTPVVTYTVSFDANGGTGTMADVTGVSGEYTLPANGFTAPAGKQFKAWSVGGVEKAAGDTITVNANTTVTAIWENIPVVTYTVSFAANGGTGTMADVTGVSGEYTLPANGFTAPSGKQFKAWSVGGVEKAAGDTITVNANTTVTAIWENIPVVTYTVSFAANGGTGTMADVTGVSGEYTLPANGFTAPSGKQFKAWSVDGKEKAVGDTITVTADTTVKAVWENIPARHICDIKPVAKVEPSCTEGGKEAYYKCEGCGKFYEDVLGKKEITDLASWGNIAKIAHTTKRTVTKATPTANGKIVNYCSVCKKTLSTTVIPKASSIKLKATSLTYNGKVRTSKVIVKDRTGKTLVKNTDYTVSYAKGRKYVGKYAVKITFKGKYSGTKTLYFTIKPKATSISSLKAGSKKFTVKWKKQATQTTGYQVQYSASSKFSKAKTVTVGKNTTVSKKISKLSGKKKYYVRVRTYKTVKINGKSIRIYSGWSKAKTVTTKK